VIYEWYAAAREEPLRTKRQAKLLNNSIRSARAVDSTKVTHLPSISDDFINWATKFDHYSSSYLIYLL
jgi:hypothetical protein